MRTIISLVAISLLLLALVSCKNPSPTLVATPSVKHYQAPDVPVPANFVLSQEDSYAYLSASVRTTGLVYIGSARTDDLTDFYHRQMPQFKWMEKRVEGGTGPNTKIEFQKDREKCEIFIEQKQSETHLLIKIGFNQ
jgi:hypothetical protein